MDNKNVQIDKGVVDKEQEIKKYKGKYQRKSITSLLKSIIIVILLIVIIILLLRSCGANSENPNGPARGIITEEQIKMQEGEIKNNPPISTADDNVALPVVADFKVSKSRPYANLFNPKDNEGKFIIKYVFNDVKTGKILYESDWLEPGFKYSVDFGNFLNVGEYDVTVNVLAKDAKNYADRNGINTKLTITVTE